MRSAETFFAVRGSSAVKDRAFDLNEAAEHKENFTPKAEQSVVLVEDPFLELALEDHDAQFAKARLLVGHATAGIEDDHIHVTIRFEGSFLADCSLPSNREKRPGQ